MDKRKYFNRERPNIDSRTAVGVSCLLTAAILISFVLAADYVPRTARALLAAAGVAAVIQLIWFTWIQIKNIRPLEKIAAALESSEDKDFKEMNKTMLDLGLGYPGVLMRQITTIMSGESTAKMLSTQASLFALQSQINPHFLYNTLETIRSQALKKNVDEIADMTEALATLFRYSISRPNELSTLAEEVDNVKNYLMIQRFRFPERFDVIWLIEDEEEIMDCSLPILTIQPIVENAVHHGLENMMSKGMICIRIIATDKKIIINVEDNGEGIEERRLMEIRESLRKPMDYFKDISLRSGKKSHGIALNNVNQRIKLFFGQDYGVNISSTLGVGTAIEIVIPRNHRKNMQNGGQNES